MPTKSLNSMLKYLTSKIQAGKAMAGTAAKNVSPPDIGKWKANLANQIQAGRTMASKAGTTATTGFSEWKAKAQGAYESAQQNVHAAGQKAKAEAHNAKRGFGSWVSSGAWSVINRWKRKALVYGLNLGFWIGFAYLQVWLYNYLMPGHRKKVRDAEKAKEKEALRSAGSASLSSTPPDVSTNDVIRTALLEEPAEADGIPVRQQKQKQKQKQQQQREPPAPAQTQEGFQGFGSSSLFDDTALDAAHASSSGAVTAGQHLDFNTSFLVKMDDETEFTSFLDREGLTGKIS